LWERLYFEAQPSEASEEETLSQAMTASLKATTVKEFGKSLLQYNKLSSNLSVDI